MAQFVFLYRVPTGYVLGDPALQIAGGCPALGQGGGVEVGGLVEVSALGELT
jgi:hypothetical protein